MKAFMTILSAAMIIGGLVLVSPLTVQRSGDCGCAICS